MVRTGRRRWFRARRACERQSPASTFQGGAFVRRISTRDAGGDVTVIGFSGIATGRRRHATGGGREFRSTTAALRRWLAPMFWLGIVLLALAHVVWLSLIERRALETDVLALLPAAERGPRCRRR